MAQAYSGDVFTIQADNKNIEYVIPTSGAFSWVDSMAIPKGAKHPRNAEAFMNYILEPKVGAALTNFVNYGSPNKAAEPFIDKDILDEPADLPAGRRAREAAVPKGPRRRRAQVLRPLDRGQDGLSTSGDAGQHRRRAGSQTPAAPDWLDGQRAAAPDQHLVHLPARHPDAASSSQYSLGQRGVITPVRFSWGNLHFVELPDGAEPRLPPDLHPFDRVRAGVRRSLCVLLGFPLAYWIARFGGRFRNLYLVLVIIPFLTSYLIRMYAWQFILQRNGLLNSLLGAIGLGGEPRVPQHATSR